MDDTAETTILEEGDVRITNRRAIIGSRTYALSDITSVNNVSELVDPTCVGILLVIIVLSFSVVVFFKHWYWIPPYIGCLLLFFGSLIFSMFFHTGGKATSMVQIETASGKSNILKSIDYDHIQRVVDAIKDAIVPHQETALKAYLDGMKALLLEEGLRTSNNEEVQEIARKQTLTVLRGLDSTRKGIVLRFLHESGLINKEKSIVALRNANLTGADLSDASLRDADLKGANLKGANLPGANLEGASLQNTNLVKAYLQTAKLTGANLQFANLKNTGLAYADLRSVNLQRADLRGADLYNAKLQNAKLQDANMRGADLRDAKVTNEQLVTAKSLKGATMPDGTKHD